MNITEAEKDAAIHLYWEGLGVRDGLAAVMQAERKSERERAVQIAKAGHILGWTIEELVATIRGEHV